MKVTLTVTMEIDGDDAPAAAQKLDELLPDANGLIAAGMAAVVVRNLARCGMAASYPNGWRVKGVEVHQ